MKPAHALTTLALAMIGAPLAAVAGDIADYTFNVPVSISKLGPGHRAEVQCRTGAPNAADKGGSAGLAAARASTPVPLDGTGNYSGTIQVKIPAGNFAPRYYECDLMIDGGTAQGPRSATMKANGNL
jgi:hypothetical protein